MPSTGGLLDEKGKGDTRLSRDPDAIAHDVRKVLAEIVASRHASLPLFFTIARTMIPMRDHDVVMVALDPR